MAERKIFQSPAFGRKVKKLKKNEKKDLDQAVAEIRAEPGAGEEKVGDLAGVFVHRFRITKQLTLLSYLFDDESITLIAFGSHENFYRDLKNYMKD